MKQIKKGATSQTIAVYIENSSTGAALTGLAYNTASLVAYYWRAGANSPVVHTLANLAAITTAWASGGFKEIDATNMPGWYRLDIIDAVLASGVDRAYINLKGAANMKDCPTEIMLTAYDPQDTVRLGLTALPNVAHTTAGGLPTVGTGASQINPDGTGHVYADTRKFLGTATSLTGGKPDVNALTVATAVATQVRDAVFDFVVDTFSTAKAALTTSATFKDFCSLVLSYSVGRSSNGGTTFKTPDATSNRIVGTVVANERTAISLTPST